MKRKENSQNFIPISKIENGVIITEDSRYIKILEIFPINFAMESKEKKDSITDSFSRWLKTAPGIFTIKCLTQKSSTSSYIDILNKAYDNESNAYVKNMISNYITLLADLSSTQSIDRRFYLIYEYSANSNSIVLKPDEQEIIQQVNATAQEIISNLSHLGNIVIPIGEDLFELYKLLYNFYNRNLLQSEPFESRLERIKRDTEIANNIYAEEELPNVCPADLIAPRSINTSDSPDYVIIDGMYFSYFYLKSNGYPSYVETGGWIESLLNFGYGVELDMHFEKRSMEDTKRVIQLGQRMSWLKLDERNSNNMDYEKVRGSFNAATEIRENVMEYGEDLYDMSILITVFAKTKAELYQKKADLINYSIRLGIELDEFKKQQEEGFISTSPLNKLTKDAKRLTKHNVTTRVIAATYPFTSFALHDEDGILMGLNTSNSSLAIYNPFAAKYPNANMTIFGASGMGKTFSLLTVTTRLRYLGKQIFIIAPEKQHEFFRISESLGGEFIDISASAKTRINPFEIWPQESEEDRIIHGSAAIETSWLIEKITALETWIRMLIPDITQEERAIVKKCLFTMYKKKGITENNDTLFIDERRTVKKEMPTYSDLVDELKSESRISERIILVLEQFTTGIYKNLNGQTNVDLNNKYIVFGMQYLDGELKAPMMFIMLKYIWSVCKSNKTKQKVIAIDEGSLLVNGKDSQVGDFVTDIFRLIRGYGGSAIFATQSVCDLYANNSEFGNTILSCSHSHILLGMEARDLRSIKSELELSSFEMNDLAGSTSPGYGLLCAGQNHIPIKIIASKEEKQLFSTDISNYQELYESKKSRVDSKDVMVREG